MSKKNEALRHANKLDAHEFDEPHGAAAELRRQHEEIVDLKESVRILLTVVSERDRIEAQRDEARRTVREAHEAGTRLTAQRDALLEKIKAVIAAEQSEGRGRGGFINTPPTREHQRRVAQAWQELHAVILAVEENT